jgi:DNA modification methylase
MTDAQKHINRIQQYNVLNTPWPLPDNSVDCCVTSPPYWALRNYGVPDQIGMESTPELYVQALVKVFDEVKRVLKPSGTLWLNISDTYFGGKGNNGASKAYAENHEFLNKKALLHTIPGKARPNDLPIQGLKPKDMVGIPWMVAFALRAAGWYLRQDIIWSKPNAMPESVKDRCTKAHEYLFLLSKSQSYYFALIQEPASGRNPGNKKHKHTDLYKQGHNEELRTKAGLAAISARVLRNKRSVWNVATKPFKEAHFATFPEKLITPCILAGCPTSGLVLDPFIGSGTTALVSLSHGRKFIGFELNPDYIAIANKRLKQKFGMFYNPS